MILDGSRIYSTNPLAEPGSYWPGVDEGLWTQYNIVNSQGFDWHYKQWNLVKRHGPAHVHDWPNNMHWMKRGDCIYVRLRNTNDKLLFQLTFPEATLALTS